MFGNPGRGLQAMGESYNYGSITALHKVIDALKEDVPVSEMSVISADNKRIPLDHYLSNIKRVGEMDEFFLGASQFDIWNVLPQGIALYHDAIGLSVKEVSRLLGRFNQYTWNEYEPGLREKYMWALNKTLRVADETLGRGWNVYDGNPELSDTLYQLIHTPQFSVLKGAKDFMPLISDIQGIEKEVQQIPQEKFFGCFTKKGREQEKYRMKLANRLEPELKKEAQKAIQPLTELGRAYRNNHIASYYPEVLQQSLF